MTTEPQGREPVQAPPIKASFEINGRQGIQLPESMLPKDADGKPMRVASDKFADQHLEAYRAQGVGEDVLQQLRDRKPVSAEEQSLARHRLNALKADPEWSRKYLAGGAEERKTMATLSIILGSPTAEKAAS
ncbi:hypothetical protein JIR23_21205 [Bradyrhizobium diazoefficiens]|nr:hypothetical protein [Bradyrhizobium diazoefficiens]QQN62119.1 hypothetical protein JIR23_21205 [Bradyrhizobium diazoefficiens]